MKQKLKKIIYKPERWRCLVHFKAQHTHC